MNFLDTIELIESIETEFGVSAAAPAAAAAAVSVEMDLGDRKELSPYANLTI